MSMKIGYFCRELYKNTYNVSAAVKVCFLVGASLGANALASRVRDSVLEHSFTSTQDQDFYRAQWPNSSTVAAISVSLMGAMYFTGKLLLDSYVIGYADGVAYQIDRAKIRR